MCPTGPSVGARMSVSARFIRHQGDGRKEKKNIVAGRKDSKAK